METPKKKQSFLQGAALLASAVVIVKIIGALYKIPLANIIDDAGFGYFNNAYDIYSVLLMISTAGLPVAMSRMIAEANSLGRYGQIRRIYQTCLGIFLLLGGIGSILMTCFSRQLANALNSPNSWAAIQALGPSALFMCITSSFRGYFQGQGDMAPTSISQVLEAICKLFIGLGLAWFMMKTQESVPLAAGGAILGVTAGSLVAMVYLYFRYRKAASVMPKRRGPVLSLGETTKQLLSIAVPITIGAAGLQVITLIDTKLVLGQLTGPCGLTQAQADELKGIYSFTQTIFNLPCAFIAPITISVIPSITEFLTLKNYRAARRTEESALRVLGLLIMPCAVGLVVLSNPILSLLRGYTGENLVIASRLLSVLGVCVVFNSIVLLTNAMMQAHGHASLPVINMFIGGIVKIIVNYILVGNPHVNIQGAPIGTLCCYVCITVLNLYTMRKCVRKAPDLVRCMFLPFVASVLMGVATFGTWKLLSLVTHSRIVLCGGPIVVAVAVYVLLVYKMKIITYQDCMLLPKGEQIAKFLKVGRRYE